jgi:nicotinamide riboside kinase
VGTIQRPQRVAILGAESTGKSWLAQRLAAALQMRAQPAHTVNEVLRDWCDREGRTPQRHEQWGIATQQAKAMDDAVAQWQALATNTLPGWVIADTTPLMTAIYSHLLFDDDSLYPMALNHQAQYEHTLLTGLDLPWVADGLQRDGPQVRGPVDTLLRRALERAGIAYRVVYGQGHHRLNNALLALGLPGEDAAARTTRENAQFTINQGRTLWQCNECSDPDCEHKLFSGLLAKRVGERPL